MRWEGRRESGNIEDRRGRRIGGGIAVGGGTVLLVLVASLFLGQNPLEILQMMSDGNVQSGAPAESAKGPPTDSLGRFAAVVLASTEDTWQVVLPQLGRPRWVHSIAPLTVNSI